MNAKTTISLILATTLMIGVSMVMADDNPYFPAGYIGSGDPGVVNTVASINGGDCPPVIEYVWVLPDEDSITAGTQIWPYPSTNRTDIYGCLVVSDPNGRDDISDVWVDVYHPDGSFKYQAHAVKLDIVTDADAIHACKDAALATGLITAQDHADINYEIFDQPLWYMYKVDMYCHYHQPAGDYEVEATATDGQSEVSTPLSTYFNWVPSVMLEIDFLTYGINFGAIVPGVHQWLQGDTDMNTPAEPTLKNEGNVPIVIGLEASQMLGVVHGKTIVDFDAQFRGQQLFFGANEPVYFSDVLELCHTRKIDFSVEAIVGRPADDYSGTMTIYASEGA